MALDMSGLFVNPALIRSKRIEEIAKQQQALGGLGGSMSGLLGQIAGGGNVMGQMLAEGIAQQAGLKTKEEREAEAAQSILGTLDPNDPQTYVNAAKAMSKAGLTKVSLSLLTEGKRLADAKIKANQVGDVKVVDTKGGGKAVVGVTPDNKLKQLTSQGAVDIDPADLGKGELLENVRTVNLPGGREIVIGTKGTQLGRVTSGGFVPISGEGFGKGADYVVVTQRSIDPDSGQMLQTDLLVDRSRLGQYKNDPRVITISDLQGNTLGGNITPDDIFSASAEQTEADMTQPGAGTVLLPGATAQAQQPSQSGAVVAPAGQTTAPKAPTITIADGSRSDLMRAVSVARQAGVKEGAEKVKEARQAIQTKVKQSLNIFDTIYAPEFDNVTGISPGAYVQSTLGRGVGTREGEIAQEIESDVIGNAINNAKKLGVNPTDKDFEASKKTMPARTDAPTVWRNWLERDFMPDFEAMLNSQLGVKNAKPVIDAARQSLKDAKEAYSEATTGTPNIKTSPTGIKYQIK